MAGHSGAAAARDRAVLVFALLALASAEDEAPASLAACGMAATLMGTVVFMMSVFYLLNHSDDDMRRYSANVVSSTISIFCAVLMFQAINGWLEEKLSMEHWDDFDVFLFDAGHMVVWFALMQVALALSSGALLTDEVKEKQHLELREVDVKGYATLLAHMTGFAAINAFAQLQQTEFFRSSSLVSFVVVPIALVSMYALQRVTFFFRERIALADGLKDEFETLWDEETEEAENDVFGLALSFTTVQSIRFLVGGLLPNVEGAETKQQLLSHSFFQHILLFVIGVFFAALTFFSVYVKPEETVEHLEEIAEHVRLTTPASEPLLHKKDREGEMLGKGASLAMKNKFLELIADEAVRDRFWEAISMAASMTMAWCFFFSARGFLSSAPGILSDDTENHSDMMMLALLQALVLSTLSFALIRVLDMIDDRHRSHEHSRNLNQGIKQIIRALGILVGFAWEQCFDRSVFAISSRLPSPITFKLLFAVFVFVVLVPAWKWWILPMDVCWGWKNPALAQIHNHDDLEQFMKKLREDFEEKLKEGEKHEDVQDIKDDAKLHRVGRDDVQRVYLRSDSKRCFAQRHGDLPIMGA